MLGAMYRLETLLVNVALPYSLRSLVLVKLNETLVTPTFASIMLIKIQDYVEWAQESKDSKKRTNSP